MIRYVLAGMVTVAGFVLLFLGSFGGSPVPVGARDNGGRVAVAQGGTPGETVDSLREQLARARQDLAALEAQKQADGSSAPAPDDAAARNPAPAAGASSQSPAPSTQGAAVSGTAAGGRVPPHAAGAQPPAATADGTAGHRPAAPAEEAAPAVAKAAKSTDRATSSTASDDPSPSQQARGSEPTQPFGFPRNRSDARAATPPQRPTREAAAPAPRDVPPQSPSAPSAADDVVERLRRDAVVSPAPRVTPPLPTALPQMPAPRAGPHRIPTEERLADARLAVLEGRVEDARRFLQAAQVQLVFQPVDPNDSPPPASLASGPVGQALVALGYGDRGRALVAIDQAIGVLNGLGRLGSAPGQQADAGRGPLPLPTPRSWP
ncbi:MAG: hypothetical protein BGO51_27075 [Rhodospirillales bacterium 69-11]|nr:MAG: hypothetical protein BGO51_27075 [Rhodospirillales bacterium 69-11]